MAVANIGSEWIEGNLVFFSKKTGQKILVFDADDEKLIIPDGSGIDVDGDNYVVTEPDDVTIEVDGESGKLQIKDEGITVDKLQGMAVLSALAVRSAAFAHDDSEADLLAADGDDDRAILVIAHVVTELEGAAEFSIETDEATALVVVAVPTDAKTGDTFVGAITLDKTNKIVVDPTTGVGAAGEIIVTVFALKDEVAGAGGD